MGYPDIIKNRAIELSKERGSARNVLEALGREFPEELRYPDERTIRRWRKAKPAISAEEEKENISLYNHRIINMDNSPHTKPLLFAK